MTKGKNAITIGAGLLGVTGAALLGTGHAHAATTATVKYNQGATTVWTSPEAGQQVKRYVFKNQSFKVLAKRNISGTTWYQVGQDEWINGKYVSVSTNNTDLVLTPDYNGGAVTVWATPAYTQPTGQYLTKGQKVNAVAKHVVGHEGWYQLDNGGWVPSRYVKVVSGTSHVAPLQPATQQHSVILHSSTTTAKSAVAVKHVSQVTTSATSQTASVASQAMIKVNSAVASQASHAVVTSVAPKQIIVSAAHKINQPTTVASQATSTAKVTTTHVIRQVVVSAAHKTSQAASVAPTSVASQQVASNANKMTTSTAMPTKSVASQVTNTTKVASVSATTHAISQASQQTVSNANKMTASTAMPTKSVASQATNTTKVTSVSATTRAISQASQQTVSNVNKMAVTPHNVTSQTVNHVTKATSNVTKTSQVASVAPTSVASQQVASNANKMTTTSTAVPTKSVASQAVSTAKPTTSMASHVVSQASQATSAAHKTTNATNSVTNNHQQTPTNSTTTNNQVAAVIKCAEEQLGKPYVSGGKGPNGFDCSGLMHYVFLHGAGKEIGGWTVPQESAGTHIAVADAQPGDILFWGTPGNTYHDALYIGNGEYIAAPQPGEVVDIEHINSYFMPSFAERVL